MPETTATYVYYGGGTEQPLIQRSGQTVTIVRELGDDERDEEVGRMFRVRFADGFEASAFEEELKQARTVYVTAFQHKTPGEGIGGFEWRETLAEAQQAATIWNRDPNYEGVVEPYDVPADLDRNGVTLYIDGDYIDWMDRILHPEWYA